MRRRDAAGGAAAGRGFLCIDPVAGVIIALGRERARRVRSFIGQLGRTHADTPLQGLLDLDGGVLAGPGG